MANVHNDLCKAGTFFCQSSGRCEEAASQCAQSPYIPNVTIDSCLARAQVTCLAMANSFEAAACVRAVPSPQQPARALTQEQLTDMIYFPEAALRGRVAGRACLSSSSTAEAW